MKFRKGDKVLISRVNSGVGDKPWRGVYVKLDKPSDFSRAYGRQAIVDIGGGTITVNVADLRLDKARNPHNEKGERVGEDMCDMCMSSGVNVDRTTYCGKTIGIECGCDEDYKDGTCGDDDCRACRRGGKSKNPNDDEDEPMEEEDDFDLKEEMREGGVIGDGRGGLYDISLSGKHLDSTTDFDEALKLLCQAMEDEKYYPNIFYVNDHGNVDHLWVKTKMRKGKVIKVESKILRSWV